MDMTRMPSAPAGGSTSSSFTTSRAPRAPRIFAMDGPLRSASRTATRQPSRVKAQASPAVIVDLPTPPLPETTATMKRIGSRRRRSRSSCAPT